MSKHTDFILTPINTILDEAVYATARIGTGIETYTLSDYIMQSIFLKMTGFQEQKMKCIAWEMGTNDNEYRRRLLNNEDNLGEYSTYKAKNKIYTKLIELIKGSSTDFSIDNDIDRSSILNNTMQIIRSSFADSVFSTWNQKGFDYICNSNNVITIDQLLPIDGKNLFQNILINKYDALWKQRNRLAHNTASYQQNLPTLKTLLNEDDESRNYFVWFSILIIIDSIFIELYKIYQEELKISIY